MTEGAGTRRRPPSGNAGLCLIDLVVILVTLADGEPAVDRGARELDRKALAVVMGPSGANAGPEGFFIALANVENIVGRLVLAHDILPFGCRKAADPPSHGLRSAEI